MTLLPAQITGHPAVETQIKLAEVTGYGCEQQIKALQSTAQYLFVIERQILTHALADWFVTSLPILSRVL